MAGIKTNSNSITAILVERLNYKKSGFLTAILKLWNLPDDIFFTAFLKISLLQKDNFISYKILV